MAEGIKTVVSYKRQTAKGTKPTATGATRLQEFNTFALNETVDVKNIDVMNASQMRSDVVINGNKVDGSMAGKLGPAMYFDFIKAALRQDNGFTATTGAITTLSATSTTGAAGTLDISTGSFVSMGFMPGTSVRCTGFTAPATANNSRNFYILGVAAQSLSVVALDGDPIVAKAAGDTITCSMTGECFAVLPENQVKPYFFFEKYHPDVTNTPSMQYLDCVVTGMDIDATATDVPSISFTIMGLSADKKSVQYFTSPTNTPDKGKYSKGLFYIAVDGQIAGCITSIKLSQKGNSDFGAVCMNSRNPSDIINKTMDVTGSITAVFDNDYWLDKSKTNEAISLFLAFKQDNTPAAEVLAIFMPKVILNNAKYDVKDGEIMVDAQFTSIMYNGVNSSIPKTVLMIQDTAA
jgi:hypothetical protein